MHVFFSTEILEHLQRLPLINAKKRRTCLFTSALIKFAEETWENTYLGHIHHLAWLEKLIWSVFIMWKEISYFSFEVILYIRIFPGYVISVKMKIDHWTESFS